MSSRRRRDGWILARRRAASPVRGPRCGCSLLAPRRLLDLVGGLLGGGPRRLLGLGGTLATRAATGLLAAGLADVAARVARAGIDAGPAVRPAARAAVRPAARAAVRPAVGTGPADRGVGRRDAAALAGL